MLSAKRLKKIQLLKTKKGRLKEKLFLIEGKRSIENYILQSNIVKEIVISDTEIECNKPIIDLCIQKKIKLITVSNKIISKLSDTKTPSGLIGICKIITPEKIDLNAKRWLYLHKIKDPGNMGTLLRTAAWFNIKNIALSVDSADPFNNKVVRSAMGAHTYINIYQKIDVVTFIKKGYLLIGADQNGKSQLEDTDYTKKIMLCLGSEAEGFDKSFKNNLDRLISIKKIGQGESLNVAIAGSILMNEISIK